MHNTRYSDVTRWSSCLQNANVVSTRVVHFDRNLTLRLVHETMDRFYANWYITNDLGHFSFVFFVVTFSVPVSNSTYGRGNVERAKMFIDHRTKRASIGDVSSGALSSGAYAWTFCRKRCSRIAARFRIPVYGAVATTLSICTFSRNCRTRTSYGGLKINDTTNFYYCWKHSSRRYYACSNNNRRTKQRLDLSMHDAR